MTIKLCLLCFLCLGVVAAAADAARAANPVVIMETSMGTIKIELYEDKAPITVKNFLSYVDDKHYDGTTFHRVIATFMVQGGGMEPGLKPKKTKPAIKNESSNSVSNLRGTLAMARTGEPDSATSQFFINVKDNNRLDKAEYDDGVGYCVFGRVTEGLDVVDKIKAVATGTATGPAGTMKDVPKEDVTIKSVTREKK